MNHDVADSARPRIAPVPRVAGRTAGRLLLALLSLCVAACGGEPAGGAAKPSGLSGRFRLEHENGASDLVLEEKDGVVTVTGNGQTSTGRVVAPGRVEGKEEDENGSGTFVLELQGDRLVARFTLRGPTGETVELPELTFQRVTDGAAGPGGSAAAAPSSGARDAALHGHWRHTEAHASGGFSIVTDHHLVLDAEGRYEAWSRTEGSAGSSEGERTTGVWEAKDGALRLRQDGGDGWAESRYQLSGDTLLRTYPSGDKEVFERL